MTMKRCREATESTNESSSNRVFECKTCNRQFLSFQALGGHTVSHKRKRSGDFQIQISSSSKSKPKVHQCSICGLEFGMGQALGGHMRRHRATMISSDESSLTLSPPTPPQAVQVFKRSNSSKRVLFLDLNLSPPENDFEFLFENHFNENIKSPMIHCFI